MSLFDFNMEGIHRLRSEGVFITLWIPSRHVRGQERAILFTKDGLILLQDNALWVRKIASRYGLPLTVLRWEPERRFGSHSDDDLFLTPWGARTLKDGLEMRELANRAAEKEANARLPPTQPFDNYTNAEDTFIDQNGMSSDCD